MARKRSASPLDLKTGRLAFTPVLRSTGERLDLEVDHATFPHAKHEGFHGYTQDLKTGKWYAVYGKECDIPGCRCDAWVDEVPHPVAGQAPDHPSAAREDADHALGVDKLIGAIQTLLTIEGVEGVGQPVTLISPADLPPDFLGFVERLRAGAVELDEEILFITLPGPRKGRRKSAIVLDRVREALAILIHHAVDQGVSADNLSAALDAAKRRLKR